MKTAKRQLNKHDAAEETTKRLESIMASFDAFDADMRIGTRQRREKDEFKVFHQCDKLQAPFNLGCVAVGVRCCSLDTVEGIPRRSCPSLGLLDDRGAEIARRGYMPF